MTERIHDAGIARAPERIPRRHRNDSACLLGTLHRRIAVLDFEMHGHGGALDLIRREHGIHAMRAAMLGKIVRQENPRAVDVNFRMHQAFAVLRRHAHRFGGAKRLFVEVDCGIGVVDDEMRGNGLYEFSHCGFLAFGTIRHG